MVARDADRNDEPVPYDPPGGDSRTGALTGTGQGADAILEVVHNGGPCPAIDRLQDDRRESSTRCDLQR